jgi:hypothetical protein
MPIYEQTYRHFDGAYVRRFRWLLVMRQELRVLASFKIFLLLLLVAELHVILRLLQIVAFDVIMQDPNHVLYPVLQQVQFIKVDTTTFFDFLRIQSPLVFIMFLYAGAGMICNDFRNNLMEVYFSKPLAWYDYALGKILALVAVGLTMTAIPGVFLVMMHLALAPSWELLQACWWWPLSITAFSLAYILPGALFILACSALIPSQGFAAITVFMILLANSAISGLLAQLLRERDYLILSFPAALHRFGNVVFRETRTFFDVRWEWTLLYILLICAWSLWMIFRKVRRAEVA